MLPDPSPFHGRTAEAQIATMEQLISDAMKLPPMQRLTMYADICNAQLTLNLMLLNRIRAIDAAIAHVNDVLVQAKGINQFKPKGGSDGKRDL